MSDGKKAAYEDEEERIWAERRKLFLATDPDLLLQKFSRLKNEMVYLRNDNPPLTRVQHIRLDAIERMLKELP